MRAIVLASAFLAGVSHLRAQDVSAGAEFTLLLTRSARVPGGAVLQELRIVRPAVMAHAAFGASFWVMATLNLEGATIPAGELAPGNWGEGFFDRRHPHTYAHEIMTGWMRRWPERGFAISVSAGKGFVPFGTDDPMTRPAVRYPVNHHWSQVLERWVAIAAVGHGPVVVEGALFNGDEPERPSQWPRVARFGDSRAARVTLQPAPGFELQGSLARVASPEHRGGAGTVHRKSSTSARLQRPFLAGVLTGLAEWSHNTEADGFFEFDSWLLEAELRLGSARAYARFERTERPEEERLLDNAYRAVRPHLENSNIGTSRWIAITAGAGRRVQWRRAWLEPVVEVSRVSARRVEGVFDPAAHFGATSWWTFSVALRTGALARMTRMGRYGLAVGSGGVEGMEDHHR